MHAVILAAGKSTRTYPLTLTRPKPLLTVAGKTIIEHNLDSLITRPHKKKENLLHEIIIVVGYKSEMIQSFLGNSYQGIPLRYVTQQEQNGTAGALKCAQPFLFGRFIVLMGDNIYCAADIQAALEHQFSILSATVKNPQEYGVITQKDGLLTGLLEKPKNPPSNLINTALYVIDTTIFSCMAQLTKTSRGELELTDAILSHSKNTPLHCVPSQCWLPIGYPFDLLSADQTLRNAKTIIGAASVVSGTVENSFIGNNCTIQGDVKNSIIMDNTIIEHNSQVENSVIGTQVKFQGSIQSTGGRGAIIGDNVIAKNIITKPDCKIWPGKHIENQTIAGDVK